MICIALIACAALAGPAPQLDLARANHAAAIEVKDQAIDQWLTFDRYAQVRWHVYVCRPASVGADCPFRIRIREPIRVHHKRVMRLVRSCQGEAHVDAEYVARLEWGCVG